jgi:hypothetical protein
MKPALRALALLLLAPSAFAYDPMADLLSTAKKEIQAKAVIESAKEQHAQDPRRGKIDAGFWQFFQTQANAKPGEGCVAVFWQGRQLISITGPAGDYRGALLGFVAIEPVNGFPRPERGQPTQKVKVSLQQDEEAPTTVTAFNRTLAGLSDEIAFPVPTLEAALSTMQDRQRFQIRHEGKTVFDLAWHSGLEARQVLRRCAAGERVGGREVPP